MKKFTKTILASVVGIIAITSCNKELPSSPSSVENDEILFGSSGVLVETRSFTETTNSLLQANGFGVAAVINGEKSLLFNKAVEYVSAENVYRVPGEYYYFDNIHSMSFYGVYPSSQAISVASGVATLSYEHNTDIDLTTAKATNVFKQSSAVMMNFNHVLSQVSINAKGAESTVDYKVFGIKVTGADGGIYAYEDDTWTPNTTTADYTVYSDVSGQSIGTSETTAIGSPMSFVPGNIKLNVVWKCYNKGTETLLCEKDVTVDVTLPQGKHKTLNLTLPFDGSGLTFDSSVGEWVEEEQDIEMVAVARIDDKTYPSVSEAFAAVADGQTVQIIDDCTFDSRITLADFTGTVTLDLNGHTLANGTSADGRKGRFYLDNADATLVITDSGTGGTLTTTITDEDVIRICSGTLKLVSGNIKAVEDANNGGNAAIWVEPATEGTEAEASVIITGGTVTGPLNIGSDTGRGYALYVDNASAGVEISGGSFSSQSNSLRINNAAGVDITGGKFLCETDNEYGIRLAGVYTCNIGGTVDISSASTAVYVYSGGDATESVTLNVTGGKYLKTNTGSTAPIISRARVISPINITGGLFSEEVSSNYVSDGYGCIPNTDPTTGGTYGFVVKEIPPVATLTLEDGTVSGYPTLEKAVYAANDESVTGECCIKLLDHYTLVSGVNVTNTGAAVTLDLNGYTLTYDGSSRIGVGEGAHLVVDDGSLSGSGRMTQSAASSSTVSLTKGTLTLRGGTIEKQAGASYNTVVVSGGTLEVDGGHITNPAKAALTVSGGNVAMTAGTVSSSSNAVSMTGGVMTLSGGEASSTGASAISITGTSDCTLTVSGSGTVSTTANNAIYSGTTGGVQTVTITGGRLSCNASSTAILSKKSLSETPTEYIVSGGLFSTAPRVDYLAAFHGCYDNDDPSTSATYPVKVIECPPFESAVFTVNSSGKKVKFSPGNLYWDGTQFGFETHQYDYPTTWNASHVGHFFWSKTASVAYAASYSDDDRATTDTFFAADGGAIPGYTVLSKDEWQYLIGHSLYHTNDRYYCTVAGKMCAIMLPDSFSGNLPKSFTADEWAAAESTYGLVALPFAGYRSGSAINNAGSYGYYWSSTPSSVYEDNAWCAYFGSDDAYAYNNGYRDYGRSVRLVSVQ